MSKITKEEVLSLQRVTEENKDVFSNQFNYMKHLKSLLNKLKDMFLEEEITMEPIPDYGDLMTIESFNSAVESEFITDWDGTGYWATDKEISRIDCFDNDQPDWATHVVWFNK